ncbi:MAG: hypothetical protein Q9195_007658 [Heterodermia aff. obscurata]
MDPCTAIGLASAIVTFVDIGAKIVRRLKELSEAGDVPEVFRDIRTRLPLLTSVVVGTQQNIEYLSPEARDALQEIVTQCFDQVSQLDDLVQKVAVSRGDSRLVKTVKAGVSLIEEGRVQRIATALRDNVQLLTFLNVTPVERGKPPLERQSSESPPSYAKEFGVFLVPFRRDEYFVGRESVLQTIASSFEKQPRVAISGIGGIGYKDMNPGAHVLWVYGGNIARFYQAYKRIAQLLEIPEWDDPEESILELVYSYLSNTSSHYLLVVDNADNIEHWWPGKYKSGGLLDDPANNLSKYLPGGLSGSSQLLITTRDDRVASRLTKMSKPLAIQPMSSEEAGLLLLSKLGGEEIEYEKSEVDSLVEELDRLPLAISQAAAFIEENYISISEYVEALRGENAEEFLEEELDDSRRDEDSVNSIFRSWKLSYDQIRKQKPCAADLLSLLAMLDRQSVPKYLLKVPEVTTSLTVLQAFNLVTARGGSQNVQMHRLVQRFVKIALHKEKTAQKWQEAALACVAREYPTEIGVAEWPVCDALAPHVHAVTAYHHNTRAAQLDLSHLLCWSADFDIERGMYAQALERAQRSLNIFEELVSQDDERLAAATWLYGRLRYYRAQSASDLSVAADLLQKALAISQYPSLNYAESAFELAHLYYDQCNEDLCLKMGKASFECWKALEGPNSVRTLDNQHDYALELAIFGYEEEAIVIWQDILERCPTSDAAENTKAVYTYRSLAGIAEFQRDSAVAEIFYAKLISLCEVLYHSEHVHVIDYRLSHAEQVMRQGKHDEAIRLSEAILKASDHTSEWSIKASCLQTIAECYKMKQYYRQELTYRLRSLELHEKSLGQDHKESVDAVNALADCHLSNSSYEQAQGLYIKVISWRNAGLGPTHPDTLRAMEYFAISHSYQGRDAEAEVLFLDVISRQDNPNLRLLNNLCFTLHSQGKWKALESWAQNASGSDSQYRASMIWSWTTALEQQGKDEKALEIRAQFWTVDSSSDDSILTRPTLVPPPVRDDRRFGRMIHPRTWSA